jgi:glycosyltransferase involved in cell wall biosynthesis
MRIAFFSDNFEPELSGIKMSIIITGKELRKRGHEICYVGPYYSPKDYDKSKRPYPKNKKDDTIDGIPIVRLPSLPFPSPTGQSRLAFPLGASLPFLMRFQPDVIHTNLIFGTGLEALLASRILRVPLVGTNHTAIEDFAPLPSVMRAYDAWYYNHCDFVSAPYKKLITRMREKGFYRPAHAIANPAELDDYRPATAEEKTQQKKLFNLVGPVVLYDGRLGVEKNVDVVLRAVASLMQKFPTLTFIATGHGVAEKRLKELAQKLGIGESVRFVGMPSYSLLPNLYKTADVFVLMSTSDSQSIALMRSYASGIPAICARSHGLPDYTPDTCGFLVEPSDYQALAEKLSLLLADEALRTRMGTAATLFVQHFSPKIIAQEWENIYTKASHHEFR